MRLFILLLCVLGANAYDDIEKKCEDFERVSRVSRGEKEGNKCAKVEIECAPLKPKPKAKPKCEWKDPFACEGKKEGCENGEYLAGLALFEMETGTRAMMWKPYCCKSGDVKVGGCHGYILNSAQTEYDLKLKQNQVATTFQCWKNDKTADDGKIQLLDTTMKPEVCNSDGSGGGGGGDSSKCDKCECRCGPFECPRGSRAVMTRRHRQKRKTCECICNCDYRCVRRRTNRRRTSRRRTNRRGRRD